MYVVEVIPFVRGNTIPSLTYYTREPYDLGTLVTIPIRTSTASAMVTACTPVSAAKTAVRAATFSLRRLPEQGTTTSVPPTLRAAAERLLHTTPTTLGAALYALLPPEVRDGGVVLNNSGEPKARPEPSLVSVLTAERDERYRVYRSRIRESFAHRGSVLFVVPTSAEVEHAYEELSRGITDRVAVFTPHWNRKKLERSYAAFDDLSHAKLIITTPRHSFMHRHDLTTIIIEQSRSPFYKSRVRPYFDTREVMRSLAAVCGASVLLGDLVPATEDEWMRRTDTYMTEGSHPNRITFKSKLKVVVMNEKPTAEAPFALLSSSLIGALRKATDARERTFLLAARRGLAPVVACGDCGHIFRCPESGRPYSLLRKQTAEGEERWFISATSGRRVRASDTCPSCGSWRLRERGIGIQHIEEVIHTLFPEVPLFLFDHTTATTYKKAEQIMQRFNDTPGSILLGTPMSLPYLHAPVDCSGIVSLDATRSIPSWRADEELFALLLSLRERTTGTVFVQTRTEPDALLEYATKGLLDNFYTDEIALREALAYPPFSVFIHLQFSGVGPQAAEHEAHIAKLIAPTPIDFYTPIPDQTGPVRNGLIRIERTTWPNRVLIDRLRTLPPSIRIEVDPPRIV